MQRVKSQLKWITLSVLFCLIAACLPDSSSVSDAPGLPSDKSKATERVFDRIRSEPAFLRIFLQNMPKGGDLHNHLSGTPYAEDFLDWAAQEAFCIDRRTLSFVSAPCQGPDLIAAQGLMQTDPQLYEQMVDIMSVRPLRTGKPDSRNGHQQFFGAFEKFFPVYMSDTGRAIASARRIASSEKLLYLELMNNPTGFGAFSAAAPADTLKRDFAEELKDIRPYLPDLVRQAQTEMDQAEASARKELGCEENTQANGCEITVRYNCFGLRLIAEAALFRQLAQCFALIEADPRFLGVSLVQPEDHPVAVSYYDRHMEMIAFFKSEFPRARISLHAGELTLGLVAPAALRSHVHKAVHVAGSERIGHGTDIAYEEESRATLAHMAEKGIAVEISLASNAVILGVKGQHHPLNLYRASGVPTVLSTDDLGVLRSDMTEQYMIAARDHGLTYHDLKTQARNSLHYAFLPGESLWQDRSFSAYVEACRQTDTPGCASYLESHSKAALEYQLEQQFTRFEADFSDWAIMP